MTKGCERKLRGADSGGYNAGGQVGKSERRLGNMAAVLPPPWLLGGDMDISPLKYNALSTNALSSLAVK